MNELESAIVGIAAVYPETVSRLTLTPEHFESALARRAWEAITGLVGAGRSPDLITLLSAMGGDEMHPDDRMLMGSVVESAVTPANIETYAEILTGRYRTRTTVALARQLEQDPDSLGDVMTRLRALDGAGVSGVQSVSEILPRVIDRIERKSRGEIVSVPSGLARIDAALGGWEPTDHVVIAARTGVGKTAMACNLAINSGVPCGFISAEQSADQLVMRFLSNLAAVDSAQMRAGSIVREDWDRIGTATGDVADLPIHIDDRSRPTIDHVEQVARKMVWDHDIKILFVDYLQYLRSPRYDTRYLEIGDVSARLKALAKDLHIPVISLAQLNRQAEGRKPRVSDIRESGAIEQDADLIALMYQDEDYPGRVIFDCQKNRHGPQCYTDLGWDGAHMRFSSK